MVKLRGPLFSVEAKGSIARCITYQTINRQPVGKSLRFSTYSRTSAQDDVRDVFSWSASTWFALHEPKKEAWRQWEDIKKLKGYQAFMNSFLNRTWLGIWQFELPPDIGFCVVGNHYTGDFDTGGGFMVPVTD